jgi:hypothetical protein
MPALSRTVRTADTAKPNVSALVPGGGSNPRPVTDIQRRVDVDQKFAAVTTDHFTDDDAVVVGMRPRDVSRDQSVPGASPGEAATEDLHERLHILERRRRGRCPALDDREILDIRA